MQIGLIIPHFRPRFNENGDTNFRLTRAVYFCKIHIDYKHKKCMNFNKSTMKAGMNMTIADMVRVLHARVLCGG